jgi:CheY-like chemotaxis protein
VIVSGFACAEDQERARMAGANYFLAKPCSTEDLANTIEALLGNEPAAAR